jgi:large subunit ribosomal protein L30
MSNKLKVTQVRSAIGRGTNQKRTLTSLRIHRLNHPVIHEDTPGIRGMIASIRHLLLVEEIKA